MHRVRASHVLLSFVQLLFAYALLDSSLPGVELELGLAPRGYGPSCCDHEDCA